MDSTLPKKTIALNFRRLSEKAVDAMGAATLGINKKEAPAEQNIDPREFMNADELKALQQCEDVMREMQEHSVRLKKELEQEKDSSIFGSLKNAITGRKTGILLELDKIARESVEARRWRAELVAQSCLRDIKKKAAAEAVAKMAARGSAPNFQPSGALSPPGP